MTLYFQEVGKGKPVVILHGLFGSSDNWRTISLRLGENRTVYSLDMRNHGRSGHDPAHDYSAMVGDLAETLDFIDTGAVELIGHSMGGKTAMRFALEHPESVSKLVVVDMAPKAYPPQHSKEIEALKSINLSEHTNRRDVENLLDEQLGNKAVVQFFMKGLNRAEDKTFNWRFNLNALDKEYDKILEGLPEGKQYEGPTLFVRGGKSPYFKDEDMEAARAFFPNAELATIPVAGHWVHAEAPKEFLKEVEGFLLSY